MNSARRVADPFIRLREVISYCPFCHYWNMMTPELKKTYFMCYWPEERVRRHLEMLKAFGYNSIQTTANPLIAVFAGIDPKQWRTRLIWMCQTAKQLGMSVAQHLWANAACDQTDGKWDTSSRALDWHSPDDRARLEIWYRDQVELTPYVDRLITHWGDPGGPVCDQCTIDTAIEMHNHILGFFRKANPRLQTAFSLWYLTFGYTKWPGYTDPGGVAAKKTLDPESEIVLGVSNRMADGVNFDWCAELKASDFDAIIANKRRVGIWAWYTSDIEIEPSLHVRTDLMQRYFRSLPAQTRTDVVWHTTDDNTQGLNMHNLYVAGHLMQDPSLDAQKLLDEFVVGFVGERQAPAVAAALRAIEQTRTRSRCFDYRIEDNDPTYLDQLERKAPVTLPAGWVAARVKTVEAALEGLRTVTLDPAFKTAWPVTLSPALYLGELNAHLLSIRQMLAFLEGVSAVIRLCAGGAPKAQLEAAINALPPVKYDPAHTAGLDARVYEKKLAALKKAYLE